MRTSWKDYTDISDIEEIKIDYLKDVFGHLGTTEISFDDNNNKYSSIKLNLCQLILCVYVCYQRISRHCERIWTEFGVWFGYGQGIYWLTSDHSPDWDPRNNAWIMRVPMYALYQVLPSTAVLLKAPWCTLHVVIVSRFIPTGNTCNILNMRSCDLLFAEYYSSLCMRAFWLLKQSILPRKIF